MPFEVPVHARAAEAVHRALADGARLIVIAGEAGVGKSHVLDGVAQSTGALRAYGISSMSHLPLGALAHLVDRPGPTSSDVVGELVRQLPPDAIVAVDDMDQCDELSLALLHTWARHATVGAVIATCRTEAGVVPSTMAAFVHNPETQLLELTSFTRDETELFAAGLLDGPVDAAMADEIWKRTSGNALFIGQLVGEARLSGCIERRESGWILTGPFPVPVRLRHMLLARLDGLSDRILSTTRLLAAVGRCDVPTIERSGRADDVQRLHDVGIVQFDETGTVPMVSFSHPLFAEVVLQSMSPLQRREALREHARLERTADQPDLVRVAVLSLDAGELSSPEPLLAAARLANAGGDATQTARLAGAAASVADGEVLAAAAALAAGAEAELGHIDAAIDVLRTALDRVDPGLGAMVLAVTLHETILWGHHDQPSAAAVLRSESRRYPEGEPLMTVAFALAEADGLTYTGKAREAVHLLDSLETTGDLPPSLDSMLATSRAHAMTLLGRTDEAITVATRAHEDLVAQLENDVPGSRAKHLVIGSHALREHGRLDEALEFAERAHDDSLGAGLVVGRAWAALNVAAAHLQRGDLDEAARWAQRSLLAAETSGMVDAERLALGVLCVANASRGLPTDIRWRQRLTAMPPGVGFLADQSPIAAGWIAFADGSPAGAERLLMHGQDNARRHGAVSSEAWILHERLRMGQRGGIAARLAQLGLTSPLGLARLHLAHGLESSDADLLRESAAEFRRCGAFLFGAEALAAAAPLVEARDRVAVLAEADELAAVVGSPATPLRAGLPPRLPLSQRERLVVEMAAGGATNAAIAAELSLSVRTVENHLSRAYAKLGVRSRAELGRHDPRPTAS